MDRKFDYTSRPRGHHFDEPREVVIVKPLGDPEALSMPDQQHTIGINFFVVGEQVQVRITSLPPECRELVVSLPDGKHVVYSLDSISSQPAITAADLTELTTQFLLYLEVAEDRKTETLKGYRKRLGQFTRWLASNGTRDPTLPATWLAYQVKRHVTGLSSCFSGTRGAGQMKPCRLPGGMCA